MDVSNKVGDTTYTSRFGYFYKDHKWDDLREKPEKLQRNLEIYQSRLEGIREDARMIQEARARHIVPEGYELRDFWRDEEELVYAALDLRYHKRRITLYQEARTGQDEAKMKELESVFSESEISFPEGIKPDPREFFCDPFLSPKWNEYRERYHYYFREEDRDNYLEQYGVDEELMAKLLEFDDRTASLFRPKIELIDLLFEIQEKYIMPIEEVKLEVAVKDMERLKERIGVRSRYPYYPWGKDEVTEDDRTQQNS